ncbi:MAG: hypothetical protein ACI376_04885 [Candidatus Bruticola sp.]
MPPVPLPLGSSLRNRYRIQNHISTEHCNLYVVQDTHLTGKYWMLKEISIFGYDPVLRAKLITVFQAEAKQLLAMEHACLPKLVDFFVEGQSIYVLRDLVQGSDLFSLVNSRGVLPELSALTVGIKICDLILYLQSIGLMQNANFMEALKNHLKPSNIVYQETSGNVVMLDVGFPQTNLFLKSYSPGGWIRVYKVPEDATSTLSSEGKKLVYIIGAMLYHLLTTINPSDSPFKLKPIEALRPDLGTLTKAALVKSLRVDPRDRFGNVADLRNSLEKAYKSTVKRTGGRPAERLGRIDESRVFPSWIWILCMIFACLIGGAAVVLYQMFLQ